MFVVDAAAITLVVGVLTSVINRLFGMWQLKAKIRYRLALRAQAEEEKIAVKRAVHHKDAGRPKHHR